MVWNTLSFYLSDVSPPAAGMYYGMPGGGYYLDFTSRHNWL